MGVFPNDIVGIAPWPFFHGFFGIAKLDLCVAHSFQGFWWGHQSYVELVVRSFVCEHSFARVYFIIVARLRIAFEDDLIIFYA